MTAGSLFVAGRFFFFGQLVVPLVVAQAKLRGQRFGFADADFAAIFQEFLNKRIISGFFWDMFHDFKLAYLGCVSNACYRSFLLYPVAKGTFHEDNCSIGIPRV